MRDLEISNDGIALNVKQYQFLDWPDESVPHSQENLKKLVSQIQQEENKNKPIVVHCSAGVGRTGTLLALTQLKTIIKHQKNNKIDLGVSVFSIVRRLREQRCMMVRTITQYTLINNLVEQWISEIQ